MTTTAHAPLRHAADQALQRFADTNLIDWLAARADVQPLRLVIELSNATQGIIEVDRRTVSRWRDELTTA